ncbi:MAG: acyltransferase [Solobacterium sp.]|nr:acyltransferase [Solobacterium sp.]
MKERENNYDVLRVISAFGVVIAHVSASFVETFLWDFYDGLPGNHPLYSVLYTTIGRFTVPAFFMLSGAFLLSDSRTGDVHSFFKRSFQRVGIPAIAAMGFGVIYSLISATVFDHTGILPVIQGLLNGTPFYHLWYLPVLLGIYLLCPWVYRFKQEVSERAFCYTAIGMTAAGCLALWMNEPVTMHWNIGEAFCYLGFFLMGSVLRQNCRKGNAGIVYILLGLVMEAGCGILLYRALLNGMDRTLAEHRYIVSYAPLIAIASVMIFAGFSKLTIKTDVRRLSSAAYGVYLTHAFILDVVLRISRACFGQRALTHLDARIAIPVLAIIIFILSVLLTEVIRNLRKTST